MDDDGSLVATSISDAYNISVTGYIYDNYCLNMASGIAFDGTNVTYGVPDHTIACMTKVQKCIDSGFVLRQRNPDGSYNVAYQLSNSSVPKISAFLNQLMTVRPSNAYAKV